MAKLSNEQSSTLESAVSHYQAALETSVSAQEYLSARGIAPQVAREYRLGYVATPAVPEHDLYVGRISIPYLTPGGVVNIKFRSLGDDKPKYLGLPNRNNLFNVRSLFDAADRIAITEGELDALVFSASGVPAVGIPGATNWQQHYRYIFDDFARIVAFADGDEAGKKWGEMLREKVGAVVVNLPAGMDVNAMIVKGDLEWLISKL
jgi:DNA primase